MVVVVHGRWALHGWRQEEAEVTEVAATANRHPQRPPQRSEHSLANRVPLGLVPEVGTAPWRSDRHEVQSDGTQRLPGRPSFLTARYMKMPNGLALAEPAGSNRLLYQWPLHDRHRMPNARDNVRREAPSGSSWC